MTDLTKQRIVFLIGKFLKQELSSEERMELDEWVGESETNKRIFENLTNTDDWAQMLREEYKFKPVEATKKKLDRLIQSGVSSRHVYLFRIWSRLIAAAIILFAVTVSIIYFSRKHEKPGNDIVQVQHAKPDVRPGTFKATLQLADGRIIELDSAANGKLVQQGNMTVVNKDGQLVYQEQGKTDEVLYNKLTTARGETYGMVLSDGTKVWLNSQSSIRYPISFKGDVRQVEITGEAYFEVAPSIAMLTNGQKGKRPFIVSAGGMDIEVLGTHFNINSYADEPAIKTTLLEGKIRVHSATDNAQTIVMPGEQAVVRRGQNEKIVVDKDVDVDVEVAWRFGMFQFNNDDLQIVLRQISRWYDVDVVYQGQIPKATFWGKILRNNSLSEVLETLHSSDVHFKIEGKKIIVSQ